jgi:hypothetical protein
MVKKNEGDCLAEKRKKQKKGCRDEGEMSE